MSIKVSVRSDDRITIAFPKNEVIKLRIEDIDAQRKLIRIKGAKCRKDRYTVLSEVALQMLRVYLKDYEPNGWLFPGINENHHISIRTAQAIFEHAKERVGVKKEVTIHTLRHSFATHL
jgi:site-specific recombinase XerD